MNKPILYLFVGYPGAGKTTTAQLIAERTGAVHLWADGERHKMFGQPTHSEEESVQLYDYLNNRTYELLSEGRDVVFDTNFNFLSDREKLREIADRAGAETVIIWLTTPADISRERAVMPPHVRNNYDTGMTNEQFDSIISKMEPPTENEKAIKIDGSKLDASEVIALLGL